MGSDEAERLDLSVLWRAPGRSSSDLEARVPEQLKRSARQEGRPRSRSSSMMQAWAAGNLDAAITLADSVMNAEPQNAAYLYAIGGLYCEKAQKANLIYYGRQQQRCGDAEPSPARIFPALDFLAALCTHIPDSGQQLVRYYGAFSNVRRAQARACVSDPPAVPLPPGNEDGGCADEFARQVRSSWARLIKKVYEADPLVCPRCSGPLKIISLIGDGPVIEKILRHLKLWDRQERPPPPAPERSIQYDPEVIVFDELDQRLESGE